uniref:Uncharacterized protein n=1 Tax=Seriola lalandi dorsalis TaxID=1841481 RepID=A0A3B4YQV3_SERLL
ELVLKATVRPERRGRWRLNVGLLSDSTFRKVIILLSFIIVLWFFFQITISSFTPMKNYKTWQESRKDCIQKVWRALSRALWNWRRYDTKFTYHFLTMNRQKVLWHLN